MKSVRCRLLGASSDCPPVTDGFMLILIVSIGITVIIDSRSLIYVPTTTERKDLHVASVRNFNCWDVQGK